MRSHRHTAPIARHASTVGVMLAVLALSAGVNAAAASTTLYVDRGSADCSDGGAGTPSQPFCTIRAAASQATAGETVEVAAGTYPEAVTVSSSGTSSAPIVFTAAPGATVTVRGQANGFVITGRSWITVNGFTVTATASYGITVSSSSRITLSNNDVSFSGQRVSGHSRAGIRLADVTDSAVSNNVSHDNSDYGIVLNNGSTRVTVDGNRTFSNARGYERAAAGIRLSSSVGNTVSGNISYRNEDSGIECYPGSNNTLLYNNVTHDNGDHGIDNYGATGQRLIANTVYKNVTAGINVEGSSKGATIANNVSVDNGINSPRTKSNIRVDSASISGTTMDYDLVHLTTAGTTLIWNSTGYSSLASFQAATGREAHGLAGDPRWRDRTTGDFHLTSGSPAIDSANSGVTGQPSADVEATGRVDDPATANTGVGPRAYDDRGAYEYGTPTDSPPVAALSVGLSGPLSVTADASASTDDDATPIATYSFDFGDGSAPVGPQAGATATHTYTSAGTYTVSVTVTDTAGLSSTATTEVSVFDASDLPPSATLSVTPGSGLAPLPVTADASGSTDTDATPIESYRFDFGDGAITGPQAAATATHTYATGGTYTVTVTVTDTAGQTSTATTQVTALTNLVGNPGFETSLSGWNTSGSSSGATLTRVAGGHSGDWAAKLANGGTSAGTCTLNDSPDWARATAAGTYTGTLWVRADTAGATIKLRFREWSGSTLVGSATNTATLTTSWQQVTVTYPTAAPGSSTLDFNAYVSSAPPGTCFYADDAAISRG